jgi:hypothetical protein
LACTDVFTEEYTDSTTTYLDDCVYHPINLRDWHEDTSKLASGEDFSTDQCVEEYNFEKVWEQINSDSSCFSDLNSQTLNGIYKSCDDAANRVRCLDYECDMSNFDSNDAKIIFNRIGKAAAVEHNYCICYTQDDDSTLACTEPFTIDFKCDYPAEPADFLTKA